MVFCCPPVANGSDDILNKAQLNCKRPVQYGQKCNLLLVCVCFFLQTQTRRVAESVRHQVMLAMTKSLRHFQSARPIRKVRSVCYTDEQCDSVKAERRWSQVAAPRRILIERLSINFCVPSSAKGPGRLMNLCH